MSRSSPLGSLAVQAPSLTPQLVHVSPATCHNLSLFKDLLREYRKLDDTINMRLNRTNAQFRDRDREGKSKGNVQDETCMYIWQSLVGMFHTLLRVSCCSYTVVENWKRRTEIVSYCVEVVDKSIDAKQQVIQEQEDERSQRSTQAALYSDKVKVCPPNNPVCHDLTISAAATSTQ